MSEPYPRPLTAVEREYLMWILPEDRPGYAGIRRSIEGMSVVGMGRRGEGNIILSEPGHIPDIDSPLPSVVAFGMAEGPGGRGSVTVREEMAGQFEAEIVDLPVAKESRRWTYSLWSPSDPCPQCGGSVRTVRMDTEAARHVTLAICSTDRRLWVHEGRTGICRPVPVTLFHSELMRRSGVRKPDEAFRTDGLFDNLSRYPDDIMTAAFAAYNRVRAKVGTDDPILLPPARRSIWQRLFTLIRR